MTDVGDVPARLLAERRAFLAFLERRVADRDLAEDLLQESLVKAVERAGSVRDEEAAVAWFYRILRNAIIDRSRRAAVADRRLSEYAQHLEHASEPDPSHADQVCQCVRVLVYRLKPDYSKALEQIDLEGKSLAGYAQEAGITANNAGVRVHRARKALRKEVLGFCRMCAEHGCVNCSCKRPQGHSADP